MLVAKRKSGNDKASRSTPRRTNCSSCSLWPRPAFECLSALCTTRWTISGPIMLRHWNNGILFPRGDYIGCRGPHCLSGLYMAAAPLTGDNRLPDRFRISTSFRAYALDLLPCRAGLWTAEDAGLMGLGADCVDSVAVRHLPLHHDGDAAAAAGRRRPVDDRALFAQRGNRSFPDLNLLLDAGFADQANRRSLSRGLCSVELVEEVHAAAGHCYGSFACHCHAGPAGSAQQDRTWLYCAVRQSVADTPHPAVRGALDLFSFYCPIP